MARSITGCNVENASYGLTICAERNAVFQAVACGARQFTAVAVVTENGVTPCGACRQVLAEFNPQMTVIVADTPGNGGSTALRRAAARCVRAGAFAEIAGQSWCAPRTGPF